MGLALEDGWIALDCDCGGKESLHFGGAIDRRNLKNHAYYKCIACGYIEWISKEKHQKLKKERL